MLSSSTTVSTRISLTRQDIACMCSTEDWNKSEAVRKQSRTELITLATKVQVDAHSARSSLNVDDAVLLHRKTVIALSATDPKRVRSLDDLAGALLRQFEETGQISTLDEIIELYREIVNLRPVTHTDYSPSVDNLATALHARFKKTSQLMDLDEAVSLHEEAIGLRPPPHPTLDISLSKLASALQTRFEETGHFPDLEKAISLHRTALNLRPVPHPNRLTSLNNLATILHIQYEQTSQLRLLDEAIVILREAVTFGTHSHPDRSSLLSNLATALRTRFDQTGEHENLEEAVLLHREALILRPVPHLDRPDMLVNLAATLQARFENSGEHLDLNEALKLRREALLLQTCPHPESLNNLALALRIRFDQTGQLTDLNEAVLLHHEALVLQPTHWLNYPRSLSNLATALHTRFEETNQIMDLDEAVRLHRQALVLRPAPHPDRSVILSNLATALECRFEQTHQRLEIDEVVRLHREVLDLLPVSNHLRSKALHNIATALHTRFKDSGQRSDLDEAILRYREALALRQPVSNPDQWRLLSHLAVCLGAQFDITRHLSDVDEAISLCRNALETLPSNHPAVCFVSGSLGQRLLERYLWLADLGEVIDKLPRELVDDISKDITRAKDAFRTAARCQSASVSQRLVATREWAMVSFDSYSPDALYGSDPEAHETAISLISRLAMLGLDLKSRQDMLKMTNRKAGDAAASAIEHQKLHRAIEYLEEGRAIFWSQALQLRTPLHELESVAPELARRLKNISNALERGSIRDVSRNMLDHPEQVLSVEKEAIHYNQLNLEWLKVVKEAQELDGFHDFLRPKSFAKLTSTAVHGPIVILNVSEFTGCDALVMRDSRDAVHIPLPQFSDENAEECVQKIRTLFRTSAPPDRGDRHLSELQLEDEGIEDPEEVLRDVLETLWRSVVQPVFQCLKLEKSKSPPRLWWLPTGPFASLPIHAAGIYDAGDDSECVSDYVVSSYTPTLSTLLAPPPVATDSFRMLAVIQPVTKGQTSLPHTRAELRRIEEHVSKTCLVTLGIPEAPAYVKDVLTEFSATSIVHLACHGVQDRKNPLDNALLLEDGRLKVSQLMQLSIPNGALVFLSACQTAVVGEDLPDEPIHLATTLLFCGFRGVVATMWSIDDRDGPTVADSFYRHLFSISRLAATEAPPDTTRAANALHLAIAELRAEKCSFMRWVPFIHLGL